ncbi:class I SAM-dependent methyltransferase [Anabaena cylindrica FACHB-243]|uniref:Methyltransferase type 11 n=1 Tax=Anabaena cylindrica (strain ATCC 27899 / PCC 7122) TaxID=272123 RepID=K9ZLG5_ANACC|nr:MULTISPECIES: class I SAM-dependent methyltransferase [Anabaena]AFZ59629.1 Methyltransferase type 11 [Anabaena cylindrica PCC 7122]MBD2418709.1 class I SAM-dependent methyltransferase [Anabaena cylindrica FACHB-243]MBY5281664.1 class I SAM-dependent methyltransferase [Anabaena sp. CCAP 1446/1C]MBY5309190.1 class I SAM-dependent methyltransferase [Anabaena sp. CCAP 1446/1C]MCM2406271.1 class I SAM-dependent methyltransferase [Anabaena sp. CCAP 1446/1C]
MQIIRAFIANQLGFPSGWFGRLLLRLLNRNNAAMNDLVLQLLHLQSGVHVLEIGFGGGDLIHKIVNTGIPALIVGVERSPEALNICQQRFQHFIHQDKVELYLADATKLPFPDHHFHRLCTVNTLYFWSDALQVLTECHRILLPGGKLVISYTSKAFLDKQKFSQHGFVAYEVAEVEMMLKTAGFTEISTFSGKSTHHQEFFCTCGLARDASAKAKS